MVRVPADELVVGIGIQLSPDPAENLLSESLANMNELVTVPVTGLATGYRGGHCSSYRYCEG